MQTIRQERRALPESQPQHSLPIGLLGIWVLAKLLAHIGLAVMSVIRPISEREELIAIWPPSLPLSRWLERVWFAPLVRHDVEYYVRIATTGYRAGDGTRQFHPLFPVLARPLVRLGFDPLVALTVVSCCTSLLLIAAFYKLALLTLGESDAQYAVLSFILSPFAFALVLPYSEALFLLCAVMCLYWAKLRQWVWSGLAGALAVLTRQQGLFLLFPLLWMALEQSRKPVDAVGEHQQQRLDRGLAWMAALAVPLTYAGWVTYRAIALGDLQPSLTGIQDLIYSLLISPSATEVVPIQAFLWPWDAMGRAVTKLIVAPDLDIIVNLIGGTWFLFLLVGAWRYLPVGDRIYSVAIALVSFSYHTGPFHPYMGLLRHLLLGFPVFLGVSLRIRSGLGRSVYLSLSALGMFFLIMLFGLHAWIP